MEFFSHLGQQGGLVERLQEILCSIGFDDSSLPENITSDMSPIISKSFFRYLLLIYIKDDIHISYF